MEQGITPIFQSSFPRSSGSEMMRDLMEAIMLECIRLQKEENSEMTMYHIIGTLI